MRLFHTAWRGVGRHGASSGTGLLFSDMQHEAIVSKLDLCTTQHITAMFVRRLQTLFDALVQTHMLLAAGFILNCFVLLVSCVFDRSRAIALRYAVPSSLMDPSQ